MCIPYKHIEMDGRFLSDSDSADSDSSNSLYLLNTLHNKVSSKSLNTNLTGFLSHFGFSIGQDLLLLNNSALIK